MRRLAPLLFLFALSCRRSEDQAAKQRIFSPEEPLGTLAEMNKTTHTPNASATLAALTQQAQSLGFTFVAHKATR